MRHFLAAMLVAGVGGPVQAETSPNPSEFLHLSSERQSAYVEGVLQGMSYVMLNYDRAGHEKWVACVRAQSLEAIVVDVLHLLKENSGENLDPVPWAVTRVIITRC
jgi:hypothetical protein